jgi:ParB-like chromosome segregation protein Spo0J
VIKIDCGSPSQGPQTLMITSHPFTEFWRLFTDDELAILKTDIAAHGQRLPIILYRGQILDGRNRYRACCELGIQPRCENAKVKNDDEALMLVVSLNEHRRHSSLEERAFAAARLATLKQCHQKRHASSAEEASRLEAAKALNVSDSSLDRARAVITHGSPEDEVAVRSGQMSLAQAAAKLTPKRRPKPSDPSPRDRALAAREYRARNGKRLTREEVDPGFTGTARQFAEKYGHVQLKTAIEQDRDLRLAKITTITGAIAHMAEEADKILALTDFEETDLDLWNSIAPNRRKSLPDRMEKIERALQRIRDMRLIAIPVESNGAHPSASLA